MKKVLIIAHVISHIKAFHIPYIEWFKSKGYEVHVLTNAQGAELPCCDKLYDLDIERSPFSLKNLKAIKEAKKIIDAEGYELIHCHTPMGGVIGRLSSIKARKNGTKVLYTAHGFHFYKGAPIINWLLYYTVEKILSFFTDCIITINEEDYRKASKSFATKKTAVEKISGVGVDISKFSPLTKEEKQNLKKEYGYDGKLLLIYAAEFSKDKNHSFSVDSLEELKKYIPNIKILFCGMGKFFEETKSYAFQKNKSDYIDFLGYRDDMSNLYGISDILITSSVREGLATNVIEGMATGLPAVATDIRGHRDVVENGKNGYLFKVDDTEEFVNAVKKLIDSEKRYNAFSENAIIRAKDFNLENSIKQTEAIYKKYGIEGECGEPAVGINSNTCL